MAKQIIVDIAKGGSITAEVQGVAGPSCENDLTWLDKLGSIQSEGPTEDYEREPELLRQEDQSQSN